ncbi:hypothetical protein LEP1GSC036_4526 [Leptospira weilii str. 2006001853]|uniref:Uncharacterized protein n=1 Tax=Leptospira weilii str. 2006001853 TaxID=1001589 RepID=A0A828Z4I2_9LEPT|nr:hypothetical protein LEP1GSC036_4526 [Leptospira weilii str. 2006001853]EMN46336.1 hypothetical protein LEP1GSC086_3002 [Leptospira weilii str. LNT 1234]
MIVGVFGMLSGNKNLSPLAIILVTITTIVYILILYLKKKINKNE